jgi:hypothetical protein
MQAQRRKRRFPKSGPHPLGVEHEAVQIKNNAVKHKRDPFCEGGALYTGPAEAANGAKTPHYTSFYHKTQAFEAKKGELF